MSMLKNLRIGQSALLVSFIRTKMGKEFDVAGRLWERFSGKQQLGSYYTCYGQYDLLEFLMVDSYEAMYNVPFDKDTDPRIKTTPQFQKARHQIIELLSQTETNGAAR